MACLYQRYRPQHKEGYEGRQRWQSLTADQWALVRDYLNYAQMLARKYTNDRDLAHDLAMDALIRAAPYHNGGGFAGLVRRSLRCRVHDHMDHTKRRITTNGCPVELPREHEPFAEIDAADLGSFLMTGCEPRFRAIVGDVVAGEAWFTAARRRHIGGGLATLLRDRGRDHATARRARI